jgi:endonuclease/exonuclease/phosphatase (EEP) superfamily protein YafD
MRPPRRSTRALVAVAAAGAPGVAAGVATLGAIAASGWWPLDLFSSFHLQYAAVMAASGAAFLVLRRRVGAVWLLSGALLNAVLVAPQVLGGGLDPAADGPRLSVMSFNVGVSNPMREEIAREVAARDPDLLFLLESSFEWEDALRRWGPPMAVLAIVPAGRVAGITVLADPGIGARPIAVPFADPGEASAVELELGGRRIVVLGLHPPSPTSGERAARRDRILSAAGDWVGGLGVPALVVGDLNATPWSGAFGEMRRRGLLHDTSRDAGLQTSWPAGWGPLMIPIDHALYSGGLVAVSRSTGAPMGSAHRSLHVTVAVAP